MLIIGDATTTRCAPSFTGVPGPDAGTRSGPAMAVRLRGYASAPSGQCRALEKMAAGDIGVCLVVHAKRILVRE
ncbi:MAG: hypothetical protein COA78_30775 [Blastopirellula sp.]|nr:MAG: hypothetical protein COA78_30775 [Blastopirellula sp.]